MNLAQSISMYAGGQGSGCKGPNCGRPSSGGKGKGKVTKTSSIGVTDKGRNTAHVAQLASRERRVLKMVTKLIDNDQPSDRARFDDLSRRLKSLSPQQLRASLSKLVSSGHAFAKDWGETRAMKTVYVGNERKRVLETPNEARQRIKNAR